MIVIYIVLVEDDESKDEDFVYDFYYDCGTLSQTVPRHAAPL
jgi:hypothetical protein